MLTYRYESIISLVKSSICFVASVIFFYRSVLQRREIFFFRKKEICRYVFSIYLQLLQRQMESSGSILNKKVPSIRELNPLGGMMKIESTILSMDASSSHKEMATAVTRFAGLTSWQKFLQEGRIESQLTFAAQNPPQNGPPPAADDISGKQEPSPDLCREDFAAMAEETKCSLSRQRLGQGSSDCMEAEESLPLSRFGRGVITETCSQLDFSSGGTVQTADGRTLDFSLDLSAAEQVTSCQYQRYSLTDPLTLALDDKLPTLSDSTFTFDLDGDGIQEEIASLSAGSGFLALDKNGDGIIADGSELFGPQSGHGYQELGEYDVDGNMWIDENDPIFSELKIWLGAGSDDARLVSLKEAGVGALSLASVDTSFDMRSSDGKLLGRVSRAGIFLQEDGTVKSMAELDLNTISPPSAVVDGLAGDGELQLTERERLLQAIYDAIFRLEVLLHGRRTRVESTSYQLMEVVRQDVSLQTKFWSWQQEERVL